MKLHEWQEMMRARRELAETMRAAYRLAGVEPLYIETDQARRLLCLPPGKTKAQA